MTPSGKVTTADLERGAVVLMSPTATGWEPATRKTDAVQAKVHKVDTLATHAALGRRAPSRGSSITSRSRSGRPTTSSW